MWEFDHKESWTLKNWWFWTVVLEKTLENPLDRKEIKSVNPKGNQSWIFIGGTDAVAEAPLLSLCWIFCKTYLTLSSQWLSVIISIINFIVWCWKWLVDPWVGKIPWRRAWQPSPAFLPGESHAQRSLAVYSPWCHKASDTNETTENACMCYNQAGPYGAFLRQMPPGPLPISCL